VRIYGARSSSTTMLATESLAIADEIRKSMVLRYGADAVDEHFRSFDTICSATQERQDAILEMMKDPPDIMVVIGGYNSSNTNHLAHICRQFTTTYHIADAGCIDVDSRAIRHKAELDAASPEVRVPDWLPEGPVTVGLTAGASTPNNKIGEAIERILATAGIELGN
jgi:4-hydroxy-3-methylbut-2-enyl diphosphate reductase